jgi:6-phosphofructokinase 1
MAVQYAVSGVTDKMVGFERSTDAQGKYTCNIKLFDLIDVANAEKKVPPEWINAQGNNVTKEFVDYALPLIQGQPKMTYENGVPRFANLKKVKA